MTNTDVIAERVRLLRDHGRKEKYEHLEMGFGNRLDALQAAVLRVKLRYLETWNTHRRALAAEYSAFFREQVGIVTRFVFDWAEPVWHLYVIRVRHREIIQATLKKIGIQTGIHYPIPLHLQPANRYLMHQEGDLPHAEKAAKEVLSLPLYPEMSKEMVQQVVAAVISCLVGSMSRIV